MRHTLTERINQPPVALNRSGIDTADKHRNDVKVKGVECRLDIDSRRFGIGFGVGFGSAGFAEIRVEVLNTAIDAERRKSE